MTTPSSDDPTFDALLTGGVPPSPTPSSAHYRFAPGATIGGRYRVVSLVGRGGMGEVYQTWFVWSALYGCPMTLEMSHWSATASNWTLGLLAVLTLFAFTAARGGTPRAAVRLGQAR